MGVLKAMLVFLQPMLIPRIHLAVENLALRQQLAVFKQSVKPPKLRPRDRVFWVVLSRNSGRTGAPRWRLCNPKPSSAGIARAFDCIGDGHRGLANSDARPSNGKSANSSAACHGRTQPGAHAGSCPNWPC